MKRTIVAYLCSAALAATSAMASAQEQTPQAAQANSDGLGGDIVVTARRREENLQDVPVAITAFSSAALERSTIQSVADLNTITPGLRFGAEGGKVGTAISLRGISKVPIGAGAAGVVQYFADVPYPADGGDVPTYDLANIQVLRGPQGTLFGRNTLGGAILMNPQAPTRQFEGYVRATYGRFDRRELEGALNVPLGNVGALRVAGQVRRQDPRTRNFEPGRPGFDDIHQDSFRVSLLLEPADWITNKTIFSYYEADEKSGGLYLYRHNRGAIPALSPILDPQIAPLIDIQKSDFYGAFDGGINGGFAKTRFRSVINDTSLEFGEITVRNIFGYVSSLVTQQINTGATPALNLPTAGGGSIPFVLFQAGGRQDREYISNEFQVLGDFDGFDIIVGAFYNVDRPGGPSGNGFKAFLPAAAPTPNVTAHYDNRNFAIFGQAGINITDRLKANIGVRYSWDKTIACGGQFQDNQYASFADCKATGNLGITTDGVGVIRYKGEEPSWTIGLDYKLSDDVLLYVASRRGYRAGAPNTPLFESPYTTGGIAPGCQFTTPPATGQCPDFRPYQISGEEKVTDVEIGLKSNFGLRGARGHFNINGFYLKYEGVLQGINVLGTGIPQALTPDFPSRTSIGQGVADESIWGIELETAVSPSPNLTVSFNAAYTHTKIDSFTLPPVVGFTFSKDNVNLPTPKFSGTLSTSWTLPFHPADGDLVLNGDLFMTDDFGGAAGEQLPGYMLANTRLDWRDIGGSGLTLGVYVRNLFGEKYFTSPSVLLKTVPVNSVFVGEPRTWGITGRFNF